MNIKHLIDVVKHMTHHDHEYNCLLCFEQRMEAQRIRCPYCNTEWEDEECDCVTYHGTIFKKDVHEAHCYECDNDFYVYENVERTYETTKTPEIQS